MCHTASTPDGKPCHTRNSSQHFHASRSTWVHMHICIHAYMRTFMQLSKKGINFVYCERGSVHQHNNAGFCESANARESTLRMNVTRNRAAGTMRLCGLVQAVSRHSGMEIAQGNKQGTCQTHCTVCADTHIQKFSGDKPQHDAKRENLPANRQRW
jgi:hypothetical protein